MKRYMLLILSLFILTGVVAQNASVEKGVPFNGRILDKNNYGIKKVNVSLKEAGTTTKTDKKGYFAFLNVPEDDTLLLEGKGWKYTIPLQGKKSIKIIILTEGITATEDYELMDIGYANIRYPDRTNSGSTIYGEELRSKGITDIYQVIQMYVPGVTLFNRSDGHKGVSLRFSPTLNEIGEAIYLQDGVRINNLDQINVWDIDKIDIIKDSNIYGVEGANGVILITSRKK
jgi:TonB-dependent starch-binding outer membrane protein SusC